MKCEKEQEHEISNYDFFFEGAVEKFLGLDNVKSTLHPTSLLFFSSSCM